MVVIRYSTGSTYNGCDVSVLHMGKNELGEDDFEEYPSIFVQNSEFGTEQPVGFGEEDDFSCIGASIIEKNGKTMLRLISCVDPLMILFNALIVLIEMMAGILRIYRLSMIIGEMTKNQNC